MTEERKKVEQKIEHLAGQLSESLIRCQPQITDEQLDEVISIMQGFIDCAYYLGVAEMKAEILGTMELAANKAAVVSRTVEAPAQPKIVANRK